MSQQALPSLPPNYYLEHFEYLLDFVYQHYKPILSSEEIIFINNFKQLSLDARCLYVRLINRKVCYFKKTKLYYAEIENLNDAIIELIHKKYLFQLAEKPHINFEHLLNIFSKFELTKILFNLNLTITKFSKKNELIQILIKEATAIELQNIILQIDNILTPNFDEQVKILKFLFFGSFNHDMSRFVIRDLGHTKFPTYQPDSFVPRFTDRAVVESCFAIYLAYERFKYMRTTASSETIFIWFHSWLYQHYSTHQQIKLALSKLILKIAKFLERCQLLSEALLIYSFTEQTPSLERQARLLIKLGNHAAATTLCHRIMQTYQSADEYYFASDHLKKISQRKSTKSTTKYLKNGQILTLSNTYQNQPEKGVVAYLKQYHINALHTENYLWRSLFGLLFWDILFEKKINKIHHPFQLAPADLYQNNFFSAREEYFFNRIELLYQKQACLSLLKDNFITHNGTANPFVYWHNELWETLLIYYQLIPPAKLAKVILEMAKDWRSNSCGFPDLFTWSEDTYKFIEVKSPTDTLSSQQLKWLNFFHLIDIPAEVLRVKYINKES